MCDIAYDLYCHKLSNFLRPSLPWSMTYFMDSWTPPFRKCTKACLPSVSSKRVCWSTDCCLWKIMCHVICSLSLTYELPQFKWLSNVANSGTASTSCLAIFWVRRCSLVKSCYFCVMFHINFIRLLDCGTDLSDCQAQVHEAFVLCILYLNIYIVLHSAASSPTEVLLVRLSPRKQTGFKKW